MNPFNFIFKNYMPQENPKACLSSMPFNNNQQKETIFIPYHSSEKIPTEPSAYSEASYNGIGYEDISSSSTPYIAPSLSETMPYEVTSLSDWLFGKTQLEKTPYTGSAPEYPSHSHGDFSPGSPLPSSLPAPVPPSAANKSPAKTYFFSPQEYQLRHLVVPSQAQNNEQNSTVKSIVHALAEMADIDYESAKKVAVKYGLNDRGMSVGEMLSSLKKGFGLNVEKKAITSWSKLPDTAMVEIKVPDKKSGTHWVVARRDVDGKQYIYDNRHPGPQRLGNQKLTGAYCFALKSRESFFQTGQHTSNTTATLSSSTSKAKNNTQVSFIAAMAELADVSYDRAENLVNHYGYDTKGMPLSGMLKTLRDGFGLNVQRKSTSSWPSLSNTAMVEIKAPEKKSGIHWLVARRDPDGKQYLYDNRHSGPVRLGKQVLTGEDHFTIEPPRAPKPLRIVRPSPYVLKGCAISALTVATGEPYDRVLRYAKDVGFNNKGMSQDDALKVLRNLGYTGEKKISNNLQWSELPNLAMISVYSDTENRRPHAVVFQRQSNGEGIIYDSNKDYTTMPSHYEFAKNSYIEVNES